MIAKDPHAPPLPKGKVRQLWPPPESADIEEAADGPGSAASGSAGASLFVDDRQELDERRRRARERAQTKREEDEGDALSVSSSPAMNDTFPQWEPTESETPVAREEPLEPSSSFWTSVEIDRDDEVEP